jgi:uncharacterized tellurite resistance protein B-like protein
VSYFKQIRSKLADANDISPEHARALIDAMVLTMAAEGELKGREETQLGRILEALEALTSIDTDAYAAQSMDAASDLAGDIDVVSKQAQDIAGRLDDATLREEAYYLSCRIAAIDIDVVSEETHVLRSFVQAFEIPSERLKQLTKRLREIM